MRTMGVKLPVARSLPSADRARPNGPCEWAGNVARNRGARPAHVPQPQRRVTAAGGEGPCRPEVKTIWPPPLGKDVCSRNAPPSSDQSRAVPSQLLLASSGRSGANARPVTDDTCPRKGARSRGGVAVKSQMRTVQSPGAGNENLAVAAEGQGLEGRGVTAQLSTQDRLGPR